MLQELYHTYQQQPDKLLDLPAPAEDQLALFDEIKQTIMPCLHQGKLDEAQKWVDLAWKIAYQTEEDDQIAQANWCSGNFYLNRDPNRSVAYLEKAIGHFCDTNQQYNEGRSLIGYAAQINFLGKFDAAEEALNHSIECLKTWPDYHDWPMIYINQSSIYFMQSRYLDAIQSTLLAESFAIKLAHKYPEKSAYYDIHRVQALINRGAAAILCSNIDLAKQSLHLSVEIAEQHQAAESAGLARLNLARLYTLQGDLFSALKMLQQARGNFEIAQCENEQAMVLQYEADIYRRLMMPRHTRAASVKAAQIFEKKGLVVDCVEAYLAAAEIALSQKKYKLARKYIDASGSLREQVSPYLQHLWDSYDAHPQLQRTPEQCQHALGILEQAAAHLTDLGTIQHALTTHLLAARLVAKLCQRDSVAQYQAIIQDARERDMIYIEQEASMALAQHQLPQDAEQTLRRAADILMHTRRTMPVEELKANLLTGQMDIYVQLIEAQLKNHRPILAAQTLMEAKGGIWVDFAATSGGSRNDRADEAWLQARAELSHWQEDLQLTRQKQDPNKFSYLALCQEKIQQAKDALAEAARTSTRFIQDQEDAFFSSLPNVADVQREIDDQTVVLDYFVGTSQIHVCLLSADQMQWVPLGKVADVKQLMFRLDMLLESILSNHTAQSQREAAEIQKETADQLLAELYQQLFEPVKAFLLNGTYTLMIAPDQFLFSVPWAALYDRIAYLGEQYELALYPSSASLALGHSDQHNPAKTTHPNTSLLLGYSGDPPLEYLIQELSYIDTILPETTVINIASTTDFVWSQPPYCLHIASHGKLDARAPLFSGLAMADEMLLLVDVFNLNLHGTALVTLSACQTGVTPEQGGVALALAGAFLCAGAQTVLSSLWSVDDQATQLLMSAFYQAWQEGNSVAASLQAAQSNLRAHGFEHPFYWAAFQPLSR